LGCSLEESLHKRPPHLHKLARDGDVEAQYQLALPRESSLFANDADRREAVTRFERAAAGGHLMAMKSLVYICQKGLDGVAADPRKASCWQRKAEQQAK
jgi:TPR repeat protein